MDVAFSSENVTETRIIFEILQYYYLSANALRKERFLHPQRRKASQGWFSGTSLADAGG